MKPYVNCHCCTNLLKSKWIIINVMVSVGVYPNYEASVTQPPEAALVNVDECAVPPCEPQ